MSILVLITGTGRSGTSTMSGTLHHLGLHVPGPYLGANDSNPKGFFESSWSVKFHKRITGAAGINDFDSRPAAFARAQAAITDDRRAELVAFLTKHAAESDQVVVKDPRSVWAQRLWREAAAEAGLEIRYISMLRHPAEVIGSRTTYYASQDDESKRRRYETFNVARWINNSLLSERETRGERRAFVKYTDLLEDWRPVLARLSDELGLRYDASLAPDVPNPVDEFIDPGLRRHAVTWEDLQVPTELQDVAQQVWDDLMVLGDHAGVDEAASADLGAQEERYVRIFDDASAISHDAVEEAVREAREEGARKARTRAQKATKAAKPGPRGQLVEETGARDLLKIAGRRLLGRLRR